MRRERRLFGLLGTVLVSGLMQGASMRAAEPQTAVLNRSDGTVWLWSDGFGGAPLPVPGVADVRAAEPFGSGALLIRQDDRLWAGTLGSRPQLARLAGAGRVRSIACGHQECLAVTRGDRVLSWRREGAPIPVSGLDDVAAVAVGDRHALALSHTGRVWAWGSSDRGQLGLGDVAAAATPRPVPGLGGVVRIAAGAQHSVAVLSDGSVRVWGSNDAGELGLADFEDRVIPATVATIERAAGVAAGNGRTFVLTDDGEVWRFGAGEALPVRMNTPGEIARIRTQGGALIAERSDGGVWVWSSAGEAFVTDPADREREPLPPWEVSAQVAPVPDGAAALVVGSAGPSRGDRVLHRRLEALGLSVVIVPADQAIPATLHRAAVVVISASAESDRIEGSALARLRAPIVTWERFLFAPLGLTSPARRPSHGTASGDRLSIVRPGHPLAAGLDGQVAVSTRAAPLGWGLQAMGAEVVAVGPTGLPAVFAYETGSETSAGPAAARRVGLFLPAAREHVLTKDAGALFDAAVRWATRRDSGSDVSRGADGMEAASGAAVSGEGGASPPEGSSAGTILLVVGNDAPLSPLDALYKARLEALGFTVQPKRASAASSADATGKRMVFVSQTSLNGDVGAKFRDVVVPVAIQAAGILDQMSMTGPLGGTDRGNAGPSTQAVVTTPSHPIVAGYAGTLALGTSAGTQAWGKPSASGPKVLTFPGNTNQSTLFTYEQGAAMVGLIAPDRRVLWGFYDPIPSTFTATGAVLFDRMVLWATRTNRPPEVTAGPDQSVTVDATITLPGSVLDDGLPVPPGATDINWNVVSGFGNVTFGSPQSPVTTVRIDNTGEFVLRLTASDGEFTTVDEVTIHVFGEESNQPPVVDVGRDQTVDLASPTAILTGTVTDDGLPNPPGARTYQWSRVSGPGTVTFGTPTALTTAVTFSGSARGTHIFRLTASDSVLSSYDDVVVTVNASAVLVVGSTTLSAGDAFIKARIEALGFPVVVVRAQDLRITHASGRAFVWISSTTPNAAIADSILSEYAVAAVPLVVQLEAIVDNLLLTTETGRGNGTADRLSVTTPTHTLAAGLAGTVPFVTGSTAQAFAWGTPTTGGVRVASVVGVPDQALVFAYEQGAAMVEGTAPERRALFGPKDAAMARLSLGGKRLFDALVLWLTRTNAGPWADAGPDVRTAGIPNVQLNGRVVDDGLPNPPGVVTAAWSQVSGPATATFSNPNVALTSVSLPAAGTYLFRLTAFDGALARSDTVQVTLLTVGPPNSRPSASAGPDQRVRLPASASLRATIADDGLPIGPPPPTLTVSWATLSGPGVVTYSAPAAVNTTASFSAPGTYVIRLTVNDSALWATDDVQVVALPSFDTLFVVGSTDPLAPEDSAAATRLEALGFTPTLIDDDVFETGHAAGKALVVVSSTVDSQERPNRYAAVPVPVVCWEPFLFDDLLLAGAPGQSTGDAVTIVNPSHPLAGGLSGTPAVYAVAGDMGWGIPLPAVLKIATLSGDAGKGTVIGAEAGPTAGRRVGLFARPHLLNAAGLALFDAAVGWAVERPAPVLFVTASTTLQAGEVLLRDRLVGLGLAPLIVPDESASAGQAAGKALVLISGWADPALLSSTFRNVQVPVVVGTAPLYPAMGMTGTTNAEYGVVTGTDLEIADPTHPMAAMLRGVQTVGTTMGLGWGHPSSGAKRVAQIVGQPAQSVIFGYEPGAVMTGIAAPDRRVGLFIHADTPWALNATGWALVDAAILWAARSDADRDGLDRLSELRLGTDPANPDTNGDGILDGAAVRAGISPTNLDLDSDGLTNAVERQRGTDPFRADTDGDGVNDGEDCFPLDILRWQCPPPIPGDTIPPTITLTEPPGAVLISTVP